jgi:hypothetical protein
MFLLTYFSAFSIVGKETVVSNLTDDKQKMISMGNGPDLKADIWVDEESWTLEYEFTNIGDTWNSENMERIYLYISIHQKPSEDALWEPVKTSLWGPWRSWEEGQTLNSEDTDYHLPGKKTQVQKYYYMIITEIDFAGVVIEPKDNNRDVVTYTCGVIEENNEKSITVKIKSSPVLLRLQELLPNLFLLFKQLKLQ